MSDQKTIFKCLNLSYTIQNKTILSNINLSLPEGKVVGIIGANGAGKTTLLKLLQGHLNPSKGEVLLGSESLINFSLKQRAQQISFVSQHSPLVFDVPVIDVVKAGRLPHTNLFSFGQEQAQVNLIEQALHKFELWDLRFQSFESLSGGEQQRAYLAQSFVQDAKVLLLDEPINHLDIKHQLQILTELKELNRSTILTIHDLNLAMRFCDYLILLHKGEVIASGNPCLVLTEQNIELAFGVKVTVNKMLNGDVTMSYHLNEGAN